MSTEASPAQNKPVKNDVATAEPVLNTQVEPSSEQPKSTEEAPKKVEDNNNTTTDINTTTTNTNDTPSSPTTEDANKSANAKFRAMFSTFSKVSKKEGAPEEAPATENTTEVKTGSSPPHGESKLSKGLGNLFSRVMPATTHKEHEAESAPATDKSTGKAENADTVEGSENTPAAATTESNHPVDVTQYGTPSSADHASQNQQKRQSLLSKFFGKKKEDEHVEKEHENEETEPNTEREVENVAVQEANPSSPPLGRRLTGFFSKKIPKLDKKQKASATSDNEGEAKESATSNNAADKELPQQPPIEETPHAAPVTAEETAEETAEGVQPNTLTSNTPAIVAK
ncbi:hypothetical protein K501DRAFT_335248 [Backusella circina FSU 941]|nr:hypothetical protein K501DRAFT_335248 [Backusella circina FSU 941]